MSGLWRWNLKLWSNARLRPQSGRILTGLSRGFSLQAEEAECVDADKVGESEPEPEPEPYSYTRLRENVTREPEQVVELVDEWRARAGNSLTQEHVHQLMDDLSKLNSKAALKLTLHVKRKKLVEFSQELCVQELELLSYKYHRTGLARGYYLYPDEWKTERVTVAYIQYLIKGGAMTAAWGQIRKLPQRITTPETFNVLLHYYYAREMHEHVLATWERMKKCRVGANAETYLHLLNCKKRVGGLEGIEEEARKVVEESGAGDDRACMEVYGHLGDGDRVGELWEKLRARLPPHLLPLDIYNSAFSAFLHVGDAERAREVMDLMLEFKVSPETVSPYLNQVEMYGKLGLFDEAKKILQEKLPGDEKKYLFDSLLLHHLKNNEIDAALGMIGDEISPRLVSFASYETTRKLLEVFKERKDFAGATRFMFGYRGRRHGDIHVFNRLLEVYVACRKRPDKLIKEMFPYVVPNEKTMVLLLKADK